MMSAVRLSQHYSVATKLPCRLQEWNLWLFVLLTAITSGAGCRIWDVGQGGNNVEIMMNPSYRLHRYKTYITGMCVMDVCVYATYIWVCKCACVKL